MTKLTFLFLLTASLLFAASVEEYISIAEKNNPSLKSAYFNYKSHTEHQNGTGYLPDPMISGSYSISPVETRLGPQVGKISLRQDLPWSAILNDDENIAEYSAISSFSDYQNIKEKMIFDVKENYYKMYLKNKEIYFTNKMLQNYRSLSEIKDQNNSISKTSIISNIKFANKLDLLEEKLIQLNSDLSYLSIKFNLLLNRNENEIIIIDDTLNIEYKIPEDIKDIPLQNNSLVSIDHLIQKKKYEISSQERKRYPSFSIGADYIFVNDRTDMNVNDSGKDAFIASLSMTIPFNFTRNNALVNKTSFEKKVLEYKKVSMENNLQSDLRKTSLKIEDLTRQAKLYAKIIARFENIENIEEKLISTDGDSIEKLIMLINEKYSSMIQLENIQSELAIAYSYFNFLTTIDEVNDENN